ncbi:hypothetical protein CDAR_609031 [Caerostris darwini]|uniref:Uncharacterized protein n=1 Tax=Caerostris darwini TaxID=1538125 RepID=A0AAV4WJK3_9ARAC|nr:hypothetical protein CDAR_609031 [Caerostris darwini]
MIHFWTNGVRAMSESSWSFMCGSFGRSRGPTPPRPRVPRTSFARGARQFGGGAGDVRREVARRLVQRVVVGQVRWQRMGWAVGHHVVVRTRIAVPVHLEKKKCPCLVWD